MFFMVSSTLQDKLVLCLMAFEIIKKTVSKDASGEAVDHHWVIRFISVWPSSRWKYENKMKGNRKWSSVALLSLVEGKITHGEGKRVEGKG